MSTVAKLTKLKSAIKRLPSISKLRRSATSSSVAAYDDGVSFASEERGHSTSLIPVYVGKSRRRYLLKADVVDHPMFKELVDKSSSSSSGDGILVACEVVLFEHLLWMLEMNSSTDYEDDSNHSIEELVEFYK